MASLQKRGKQWYIRLRDEAGRERSVKAGPDKSVANQMKRDLESKIQRIKAGVLDPREADCLDAERVPIARHVAGYLQNLEAKGACVEHLANVRKRLGWFLEETNINRLSQLRPSSAVVALAALRADGRSDQTINHYAICWKSFTKWLWRDRRTRTDLLAELDPPKVVTTSKRSALTSNQAVKLIATTRTGKVRCRMSGEDRAWLYTLAMVTGLRRKELQSLTPESFDLDATPAIVSLPGVDTKNNDEAIQPLPSHVVPSLRSWLANKPAGRSLWPPEKNTALMVRGDLKAAGIAPEAFDFHCLRHSFVSAIVQCGGSVKDSMELARHHDADLTFGCYAHARLEDLSQVVNRLPALWEDSAHALPTQPVTTGLNGTTAQEGLSTADCCGRNGAGYDDRLRGPK